MIGAHRHTREEIHHLDYLPRPATDVRVQRYSIYMPACLLSVPGPSRRLGGRFTHIHVQHINKIKTAGTVLPSQLTT